MPNYISDFHLFSINKHGESVRNTQHNLHSAMEFIATRSIKQPRLPLNTWLLLGIILIHPGCHGNHDAKRLYDDLLEKSGYNKLVRPVLNYSKPVEVQFGLKFAQLNDVVRSLLQHSVTNASCFWPVPNKITGIYSNSCCSMANVITLTDIKLSIGNM